MRDFAELEGLQIGIPSSPLGSGGMRSKVVAAEMATAAGIPAQVSSGVDPQAVAAALAGSTPAPAFTRRPGRGCPASSCGCATPSPAAAVLTVDGGAERALRERGTSLLPVGVTAVEGEFQAGDAVEVRGRRVARSARASSTTRRPSWRR